MAPKPVCVSGWLRNSPQWVLAAASLAIIIMLIHSRNPDLFHLLYIYIRLLFILFPMIKMCYFVSRSCTGLKIFRRIIFFPPDFLTRNPPPYKTVRLYLSAENEPVGYNIMCTQRIKHISKRGIIHCYIVIGR